MTPDHVAAAFDELVRRRDATMLIATVAVGAGAEVQRSGCLVGFATQCSIEPRRFLLCLSETNHTTELAARAHVVAVHAVPAGRFDLAQRFGGATEDEVSVDKFAEDDWHPGPEGVPLLDGCPDRFVGRILGRTPLGDHIGYLLEPIHAEVGHETEYLPITRADDITPGHPA